MNSADARRELTTPEVTVVFSVDPTAVARWVHDGRLPFFTTPGGHYRSVLRAWTGCSATTAQRGGFVT